MNGTARTAIQADIEHLAGHLDVLTEQLGSRDLYWCAVLLKRLTIAEKRIRDRLHM